MWCNEQIMDHFIIFKLMLDLEIKKIRASLKTNSYLVLYSMILKELIFILFTIVEFNTC